jgi:hypothetical protein
LALASAVLAGPQTIQSDTLVPPTQRLKYQDRDGPGVLEITTGARDVATEGVKIEVRLSQNGQVYAGSGFRVQLFTPPPNSADMQTIDLVVFTLRDAFGRAFLFRGQIREGGIYYRIEGGGAYERAGTGVDLDTWTISDR